uniref:Putative ribonuclease H-like domain-containing protein n=1 Tax=Tanacetum cinerariifolium TaxID=118510 RepID=A0A6L2KKI8_TANCI|nr:putative ribonuclease H-like domain-containing protein [Tanacetum cinerariifolium]
MLIRWVLLLQGFDIEIKDKKGAENLAVDHFSRLKNPDLGTFTEEEIADECLDEHLMNVHVGMNITIFLMDFQDFNRTRGLRKDNIHLSYGTFSYRRMPFGLCNAPATFQICMTTIFHDIVEDFMEVFMDDLSDTKPMLIRWVPLLQGFDIEIKDKKGAENLAVDHFLRLKNPDLGTFTKEEIADECLDEHLMIYMDDPNITMEEYIRLEEEKVRRRVKVYNWETATYDKIWYDEDVHDLISIENEFSAIVFNDALTSEVEFSCEPTIIIMEYLLKISKKACILELKQRYFEDYYSDILYVVFIKEDMVYLCMHFTKDHEGNKINTSYPEKINTRGINEIRVTQVFLGRFSTRRVNLKFGVSEIGCLDKQRFGLELKGYLINDDYADLVQHAVYTYHCQLKVNAARPKPTTARVYAVESLARMGYEKPSEQAYNLQSFLLSPIEEVGILQADAQPIPIPILTEPYTSKPQKKHKTKRKHTQKPKVPLTESPAEHNVPLPSPSHDPLPCGEDNLKLKELMDLCTNLSNKVLDMESEVLDIKSTYKAKIEKLESRVERLEEKNRVLKEHKGVHSTIDFDEPVMEKEESSKQGRKITDIDADVLSMLDVNDEEPADVEEVLKVVKAAKLTTEVVTTAEVDVNVASVQDTLITATEVTKVIVLRKRRGVIIQDPKETTTTVTVQPKNMAGYKMDYFKGMSYDEIRPLFEKHYNYNQAFLNKVNEGIKVPEQEIVPDDDDVYTDATPLASKIPIINYKIHTERNRPHFKIIKVDGNHRLFLSFSTMMKNFDREDLESLWKIIRERFEKTEPKNYSDDYLLNTLKIMFEKPNFEANVWKDQKGKYGLAKIKVDDESEMYLELLRLVRRQLNEGKNELKARGTLLMALPDKHQLNFNSHKDAKTLMEAIKKRFGENIETKKVQKSLLKQQFENFTGSGSEGLDQIHDRFQKLVSQLEIHGVSLSQEDVNPKFLRSLPSDWKAHTLIWRNKADLEDKSLDDFTTNLVIVAVTVSAVGSKLPASPLPNVDSLSNAVIYSFFASRSSSPQLDNKDLKQIDVDDLEEMDLRWQMAMLTMRARRFLQRTYRNLGANETASMGFDMTKVECYHCLRKGHFARECRSSKDQRRPGTAEPHRRIIPVETSTSNALVSQCDGTGSYDWSYQAEEEPVNFALIAFSSNSSSSSSDNETGLESVEARLLVYKQNESVFEENIKMLNIEVQLRDTALVTLRKKLEASEKEMDDLKLKLEKFQTSSKNLTAFDYETCPPSNLYDRFVPSGRDHVVPPPYTGTFMPPKPDLVFHTAPFAETEHLVSDSKEDSEPNDPQQSVFSFAQSSKHVKPLRHSVQPIETTFQAVTSVLASPQSDSNGKIRNRKTCFYASKPLQHSISPAVLPQSQSVLTTAVRRGNPQQALQHKRVIDSGCSRNMTGNMSYFSDFEELNGGYVSFGGNPKGGKITGKGKIKTVLLRVPRENNMYNVNLKNIIPSGDLTCLFAKATINESNLWHRRLGYISFKTINKMVKGNLVRGLPTKVFANDHSCVACKKGKQHRASYSLLPIPFWAEAVNTACYVQNRVLVTKPHNKTPYELLHGRSPSIGFMKPFGCLVTILNTLDHLGKFQGKVDEGFLVGYSVCSKAFRVFNSKTRIVQETLHVIFLENKPNVTGGCPTWLFDIDSLSGTMNYYPVSVANQANSGAGFQDSFDAEKAGEEVTQTYVLFPAWSAGSTNPQDNDKDALVDGKEHGYKDLNVEFEECSNTSSNGVNAASSLVPTAGHNFINNTNNFSAAGPSNTAVSPTYENSSFQNASTYSYDPDMPALEDFTYSDDEADVGPEADINNLESSIPEEPKRIHQALKDPSWIEAIRLFLAYASFMGFLVYQMDVKSAFLYGTIEEEVYVCQPPGFKDPDNPDKVYKVVKALYGLHQAPRAWYETLATYLLENDDIIFGATNKNLCKSFEKLMKDRFQMSSIGELTFFLGKSASTPIDAEKPLLKNPDGEYVDVHTYRSMIVQDETVVATSSTKAKYIAAASGCAHVLWIQNQLLDCGSPCPYWVYKNWLVQKKMALGKDTSNPLMANNLPKIVWYSTHHITSMKSWLVQKQTALSKDSSNMLTVDSLLKTIWFSIHHHLTNEVLAIPWQTATEACGCMFDDDKVFAVKSILSAVSIKLDITSISSNSPLLGANTPRSDEDRLEILELTVFMLQMVVVKFVLLGLYIYFSKEFESFTHTNTLTPLPRHKPQHQFHSHIIHYSQIMSSAFTDTHNMVAILAKSDASEGFDQIIDFLNDSYIQYALTVNPYIYVSRIKQFWNTATVRQSADVTRLQALVDKKKEIFTGLARMGYEKPSTKLTFFKAFFSSQWKFLIHTILQSQSAKRTSWNEFSSAMASAVIFLSTGRKFNFSKYIFDSLVRNIDSSSKFYMYLRFIQLIIQNQLGDLSTYTTKYISPALTQKVFVNMRRIGKGFSGVETPLFEGMLVVQENVVEGIADEQVQTDSVVTTAPEDVTAAAQTLEITQLKKRVKKLERVNKIKTFKLRRLKKVGTSQTVETFNDTIMKDVSNQGRMIVKLDRDEGIELIGEKEKTKEVKDIVDNAQVEGRQAEKQQIIPAAEPNIPVVTITDAPVKVATASTRRRRGVVIKDPEEESSAKTSDETKSKDKIKGILVEEPKPMKKKQQVEMDEAYARKLHKELNQDINWDVAIENNTTGFKLDYFNGKSYDDIRLIFEAKFNTNMEFLLKSKEQIEEESRALEKATPLARKVPVVDYEIILLNNKPRYKIIKADGTHQLYASFITVLKNFDRDDLETLWSIVKERFSTSNPNNFSDEYLLTTLKTMFRRPDGQDNKYLQHERYALRVVIEFGDSYKAPPEETAKDKGLAGEVSSSTKKKGRTMAITAEEMQKRKNDVKERITLLLALFDEQLNESQFKYEEISHIDNEDIEEMDIKWNLALLSMRADRFWKNTESADYQGVKTEGRKRATRRILRWKSLLLRQLNPFRVFDGIKVIWLRKMKLQRIMLLKNTKNLNTKISKLNEELSDCETDFYNYKRGLSQVEARLVKFKENEIKYREKIRDLERDIELKDNKIKYLRNELEEVKKEKESIDFKIKNASKDLDRLFESQKLDKDMKGVGFNEYYVVPPPLARVYSPPKKDLSWMGLPEFVDDTVTDYTRPTPSIDVSKSINKEQEER